MWLRYGVDQENTLVAIEDVSSGKTPLKCPYCQSGLTAKKGRIKEHHFAHAGETCRFVAGRGRREIPVLPLYDNFNIQLSGKELEQLKTLWRQYGSNGYRVLRFLVPRRFVWLGLLQEAESHDSSDYEFTQLGQIPFGGLPLMLFNQVQEPKLISKLSELEEKAERAKTTNSLFLPERLTDLRLYRAQMKRILAYSLYYLEVKASRQTFSKIGVTQRSVEERVAEVQRELRSYFETVEIQVLGVWEHRGNVELYFKHRYQDFNHRIGSLTEYYKFSEPDDALAVLHDLRRMQPKVLYPVELDILGRAT